MIPIHRNFGSIPGRRAPHWTDESEGNLLLAQQIELEKEKPDSETGRLVTGLQSHERLVVHRLLNAARVSPEDLKIGNNAVDRLAVKLPPHNEAGRLYGKFPMDSRRMQDLKRSIPAWGRGLTDLSYTEPHKLFHGNKGEDLPVLTTEISKIPPERSLEDYDAIVSVRFGNSEVKGMTYHLNLSSELHRVVLSSDNYYLVESVDNEHQRDVSIVIAAYGPDWKASSAGPFSSELSGDERLPSTSFNRSIPGVFHNPVPMFAGAAAFPWAGPTTNVVVFPQNVSAASRPGQTHQPTRRRRKNQTGLPEQESRVVLDDGTPFVAIPAGGEPNKNTSSQNHGNDPSVYVYTGGQQ